MLLLISHHCCIHNSTLAAHHITSYILSVNGNIKVFESVADYSECFLLRWELSFSINLFRFWSFFLSGKLQKVTFSSCLSQQLEKQVYDADGTVRRKDEGYCDILLFPPTLSSLNWDKRATFIHAVFKTITPTPPAACQMESNVEPCVS